MGSGGQGSVEGVGWGRGWCMGMEGEGVTCATWMGGSRWPWGWCSMEREGWHGGGGSGTWKGRGWAMQCGGKGAGEQAVGAMWRESGYGVEEEGGLCNVEGGGVDVGVG